MQWKLCTCRAYAGASTRLTTSARRPSAGSCAREKGKMHGHAKEKARRLKLVGALACLKSHTGKTQIGIRPQAPYCARNDEYSGVQTLLVSCRMVSKLVEDTALTSRMQMQALQAICLIWLRWISKGRVVHGRCAGGGTVADRRQ